MHESMHEIPYFARILADWRQRDRWPRPLFSAETTRSGHEMAGFIRLTDL
jgi:hypothetical protein